MQETTALLGIATALALGAVSPGPSFVMVARTAVSSSRADGICAALGMGVGGLFFAVASLLGLHALLLAVPSLYWALKVGGGLYLAYLGLRIWLGATRPPGDECDGTQRDSGARPALRRSFMLGFVTQVSNPKTAIVYASVFAVFLPVASSFAFNAGVAGLVFCVEAGWYALVALALSASGPRTAYLRYKSWLDRAAGGVMVALGLKLVSSADPS